MTMAGCAICGGTREEHEGRAHVFSLDGRLETVEDQQKRMGRKDEPVKIPAAPDIRENPATRLAEVLAHRGLIDDRDLLYVIGMVPPPWSSDQPALQGGS